MPLDELDKYHESLMSSKNIKPKPVLHKTTPQDVLNTLEELRETYGYIPGQKLNHPKNYHDRKKD